MLRNLLRAAAPLLLSALCLRAGIPAGDAQQGAESFRSLGCISCHSMAGEGGKAGPDLSRTVSRAFTPDDLASMLWNHAPAMWSAMAAKNMEIPKVSPDQAADLFAYFYAARFFERKGDAGRGRKLYVDKGCADCHNISSGNAAGGRPVINWASVADPIELARQMWNHAPEMRAALEKSGKKFPTLTSVEMNDITIYLQNLPQTRNLKPIATFASAQTGERLFELKGCRGCHNGERSLTRATGFRSAADVSASMWNHAALMKQSSPLRPEEMSRIVSYVWSLQFGLPTGNVESGRRVFDAKGCAGCHNGKPPASIAGVEGHAYSIVSALWNHGPQMAKKVSETKGAWPTFKGGEMTDLVTWLSTVR
jgi:cytochrome c2